MEDRRREVRRHGEWISGFLRAGLPLGLLAFFNLTRVQWNLPIDGPSIPHYGFPWRACAPVTAISLSLDIDPLAMLGNLGVYLAVALAALALPGVGRVLAWLPKVLVLLLWLGLAFSASCRSLEFVVNHLYLTQSVGFVDRSGILDQRPAIAFCSSSLAGP